MEIGAIHTVADLATYLRVHADSIYVREQVNGKWGSYSLAELAGIDKQLAFEHVLRFVDNFAAEGSIPHRIIAV